MVYVWLSQRLIWFKLQKQLLHNFLARFSEMSLAEGFDHKVFNLCVDRIRFMLCNFASELKMLVDL